MPAFVTYWPFKCINENGKGENIIVGSKTHL